MAAVVNCGLICVPDPEVQGQPGHHGQSHHAVQQVQDDVPGGRGRLRAEPGAEQVARRAAAARRGQERSAEESRARQGLRHRYGKTNMAGNGGRHGRKHGWKQRQTWSQKCPETATKNGFMNFSETPYKHSSFLVLSAIGLLKNLYTPVNDDDS